MRVVIADDSVLLREGLALLLGDAGHDVVATEADGPGFVAAMARHAPDLGIVDVRMPPTHTDEGLRAALEVRRNDPAARVVVLSQYVEVSYADDLLGAGNGGVGYLLKDAVADVEHFLGQLSSVAAGGTVLDPLVVSQLMGRGRDPVATLTPRERQVVELMAQGRSNVAIARELVVSGAAVEKHTQRIFAKLGLHADSDDHRRVLAVIQFLRSRG